MLTWQGNQKLKNMISKRTRKARFQTGIYLNTYNMNFTSAEAYSILAVLDGMVINKDGSLTIAYFMSSPEAYSFDEEILLQRHSQFYRAYKYMPDGSFVHKQDLYLKKEYQAAMTSLDESFISKSEREHFHGRKYLEHTTVLAFTLKGLSTLEKSYNENPFAFSDRLVKKDRERLSDFLDGIEQAVTIMKNMFSTVLTKMSDDELKTYIRKFVNGNYDDEGVRDLRFSNRLEIGHAKASFFAISDESYLPDSVNVFAPDNTLPMSNATLQMAPMEGLGVHLLCNHVYNQIIYFEGNAHLKNELELRVKLFGQHRNFAPRIEHDYKRLAEFQEEVLNEDGFMCRAHFNIMLWDDEEKNLQDAEAKVKETLKLKEVRYYIPTYEGLRDIFVGSIIGREGKLNNSYYIITDLAVALTFFVHYSTFKDDEQGVLFNDRLYQIPLRRDIWDAKKKRIMARNGLVVASTGGGKSATTLSIVVQLVESKHKVIVAEFGRSFEQVCKLYPHLSAHIDYDGQTALGVNPFFIKDKSELTPDKFNTLTVIVLKFWRIKADTNQIVSITKILTDYYAHVTDNHSFPSFYEYIKNHSDEILSRQEILPEFFDKKSFLHVCSQFMPGGQYENVCKVDQGNEDKIRSKDFILFELTKIKKDPFLVSVVMSILFDTIENKILSDRSTRGVLIFDEYAETQSMRDIFNGDDIHSTVAFCFQKLRKENGGVMAIIQSPSQLPDNEYTKGIIANTQLLYVLPTNETVYDQVITAFSMKNKSHINLMKSIREDYTGKHPYNELFLRFGDRYATVLRLEFSRPKFYAFQTDGEEWQYLHNDFEKTQNMAISINNLMINKNEKINHS